MTPPIVPTSLDWQMLDLAWLIERGVYTRGADLAEMRTRFDLPPTLFWRRINTLRELSPAAREQYPVLMRRLDRRVATRRARVA